MHPPFAAKLRPREAGAPPTLHQMTDPGHRAPAQCPFLSYWQILVPKNNNSKRVTHSDEEAHTGRGMVSTLADNVVTQSQSSTPCMSLWTQQVRNQSPNAPCEVPKQVARQPTLMWDFLQAHPSPGSAVSTLTRSH